MKDFVNYEQALALKELDFNEPCLGYYYNKELSFGARTSYGEVIEAPTFSQAFRWFREKSYRFNIVSGENINMMYKYWFDVWLNAQFMFETDYIYNSYEEAELACLNKLIEIAKSKTNENQL